MHRLLLFVAAASCQVLPPPPGTEALGAYTVRATPSSSSACELPDVSAAPFTFDIVVTRDPTSGQAWLTLGAGYHRDAGWDGQVLDSSASVRRLFTSCAACPGTLATEHLRLALLSRSQSDVVGGRCPDGVLDGGAPQPTEDGGVTLPGQTPSGFDALYACGALEFAVSLTEPPTADAGCPSACGTCVVRYDLEGERR